MYYIQPSFTNVGLNTRSTLQIPAYPASLAKVILDLEGGAIAKSNIPEIAVKIGSRYIMGPVPADILQAVNQYHGGANSATKLAINFISSQANQDAWKELGALDLASLNDPVFVEVVNNQTVGTPILNVNVGLCAQQVSPDIKDPNAQLTTKYKYETLPSTGSTKIVWTPKYNGAKIRAIHFRTPTNGNILRAECKRNSTMIHENITATQNAFNLADLKKVPQANYYHMDFCADGILQNFVDTANAAALEFNLYLNTIEQVTALVELYDVPYNN